MLPYSYTPNPKPWSLYPSVRPVPCIRSSAKRLANTEAVTQDVNSKHCNLSRTAQHPTLIFAVRPRCQWHSPFRFCEKGRVSDPCCQTKTKAPTHTNLPNFPGQNIGEGTRLLLDPSPKKSDPSPGRGAPVRLPQGTRAELDQEGSWSFFPLQLIQQPMFCGLGATSIP